MNSIQTTPNYIHNNYIICSLSGVFVLSAVTISSIILILVWRTKPHLHTIRHLLVCNTCIASILYCIVQTNNYIFLIFLPWETSDMGCRWRGYFAYLTICAVTYSFLVQAISRLFISILSTKYKWLITYKAHYIFITVQWFVTIVLPLPAILTKDIYVRPNTLCWVPLKDTLHVIYTYIAYYILPTLSVCVIYIYIYYRVRKSRNRVGILNIITNNGKRNLKLLRNIVVLSTIYLMGGAPSVLFAITSIRIFYLIGIVTISFTVTVEKMCTILLDRDLRQVLRNRIRRKTQILPCDNIHKIRKNQKNWTHIPSAAIQRSPNDENIAL